MFLIKNMMTHLSLRKWQQILARRDTDLPKQFYIMVWTWASEYAYSPCVIQISLCSFRVRCAMTLWWRPFVDGVRRVGWPERFVSEMETFRDTSMYRLVYYNKLVNFIWQLSSIPVSYWWPPPNMHTFLCNSFILQPLLFLEDPCFYIYNSHCFNKSWKKNNTQCMS